MHAYTSGQRQLEALITPLKALRTVRTKSPDPTSRSDDVAGRHMEMRNRVASRGSWNYTSLLSETIESWPEAPAKKNQLLATVALYRLRYVSIYTYIHTYMCIYIYICVCV